MRTGPGTARSTRVFSRAAIAVTVVAGLAVTLMSLGLAIVAAETAAARTDHWEISAAGLGPVRIGQSIDEAHSGLDPGYTLGDRIELTETLEGHLLSIDGAVHAMIAVDDDGRVSTVIVTGGAYRTEAGIGPGSLVREAEEAYGDATFAVPDGDQGRERVVFADNPVDLSFRTSEGDGARAGIYGRSDTTMLYRQSSQITSVWVIPGLELPAPEPAAVVEPAAAEEPVAEDEPVAEEPGEQAEPATPAPTLAETGLTSALLVAAGLAMFFTGVAIFRTGQRRRPWS